MALRIALDTNAYSDFRKGLGWLEAIQGADMIALPFIVLGELRAGFIQGGKTQANLAELDRFMSNPRVQVLMPDERTPQQYAILVAQLRQQGTPIPTNDIWIAALCLQYDTTLCTADAHFEHLQQLSRW